jgi:O-antigen/teichoic acid export membrane protein
VPIFHYTGAAWATFFCYFTMLVISYIWGQKYYPIPYDVKNIFIYFGLVVGMYFLSTYLSNAMQIGGILYGIACFIIATIVFLFVAIKIDKTEFASLPLIGKYIS